MLWPEACYLVEEIMSFVAFSQLNVPTESTFRTSHNSFGKPNRLPTPRPLLSCTLTTMKVSRCLRSEIEVSYPLRFTWYLGSFKLGIYSHRFSFFVFLVDASLVATAPIVHALVAATDDMVVQKRRLEDPFDGNNEPAMKKAAVSKASASNTADTPATPAAVPAASKAASEREEGNRLATELDEKGITEKAAFDALTFPEKLIFLLQNEVVPDALWWEKDGLSFGFQPGNFTEKVLKNLFPIRIKFESFIRKLNRW